MFYKSILVFLLACAVYNSSAGQSLLVSASSSADGKKITVTCNLSVSGAVSKSFSIEVASAFSDFMYTSGTGSITAPSSPGVTYTITVVAHYQISPGGVVYTVNGGATLLTNNPTGGSGSGTNPCTLVLVNGGLTFPDFNADGTPRADGEIIISWTPPLNTQGLYVFRYRLTGTTTWSTTPVVDVNGFIYNGHRYGYYTLSGLQSGAEYEIQVAFVCAPPANVSDYSSSYYAYTLVD